MPEPKLRTDTNGGLANYVLALQAALRQANAQLDAIMGLDSAHKPPTQ